MSSSDPVYEQIVKLAPFFQGIVGAALGREKLIAPKSIYFTPEGSSEDRALACDFQQRKNLLDADELLMPMVRGLVSEARLRGMSAIVQLYSRPQMQYALKFGVAAKSFLEITDHLRHARDERANVIAFRSALDLKRS